VNFRQVYTTLINGVLATVTFANLDYQRAERIAGAFLDQWINILDWGRLG
jgi:hypothetical protein